MAHPLRWYLSRVVYEVTVRTFEGTYWLRPDPECRRIVCGIFGMAKMLYPAVKLHGFETHTNHLHYLISSDEPEYLPLFMNFVHAAIARQINALRGRTGFFWARRARVIPIVDDRAVVARLRYILAQGPAAALVASPREWPGASSTAALLSDLHVPATYTSLDVLTRNAKLAAPRPVDELAEQVDFELSPIPQWAHLEPAARRAKVAAMVRSIEEEYAHQRPLGVKALLAQSPHASPKNFHKTPAPPCHASSRASRRAFLHHFGVYRATFAAAAARYREHCAARRHDGAAPPFDVLAAFPLGSMPKPRVYTRPPADFQPPWTAGLSDADRFRA